VKREKISNNIDILNKIIKSQLNNKNHNYVLLINKLELLNPLNILGKGYSLATKDDKIIKDVKDLIVNDVLDIRFYKGKVKAKVEEIVK